MTPQEMARSLTKAQQHWLLQRNAGNQCPWPKELFKDVGLPLHRAGLVWWATEAGETVIISDKGKSVAAAVRARAAMEKPQ